MSWSSVVAPSCTPRESRGEAEEARGKGKELPAVVDKAPDRRDTGSGPGAGRSSGKRQGRRDRKAHQGKPNDRPRQPNASRAKPEPKAPCVFSAPPPNAWGRAEETKERLGVPIVAHKDEHDVFDGRTSDDLDAVCEQERGEGDVRDVRDGTSTLIDPSASQPSGAFVDSATARASFAALACGIDSLKETVDIEPVGMENPGNVCFANAVVQALLGCDLFRCLLRRIAMAGELLDASCDEYPVLKAMADIGRELVFRSSDGGNTGGCEAVLGENGVRGVSTKDAYQKRRRPRAINVGLITRLVHESFSTRYKGEQRTRQIEQEDAHEFMHCLLDGMHQELLRLAKDASASVENAAAGMDASSLVQGIDDLHIEDGNGAMGGTQGGEDDAGEWLTQSGKRAVKQKVITSEVVAVARRRSAISELFEGMQATSISCRGNPPSVTMHPFLVVEIPLYDPSIDTLEAAISSVMATESISGYRPAGGRGATCEASKSERFQSLPEVLVLHMMRFQFTGSSEKLNKLVRYGTTLRVKGGWMMAGSSAKDRRSAYQLVATISHHGDSIARGHFTANVRHGSDDPSGIDSDWLNLNDECVRPIREDRVLHDTPYMLFYRRVSTS